MFISEVKEKHVIENGYSCPFCNGENCSCPEDEYMDDGILYMRVFCESCGNTYIEAYQMTELLDIDEVNPDVRKNLNFI